MGASPNIHRTLTYNLQYSMRELPKIRGPNVDPKESSHASGEIAGALVIVFNI